MHQSDNVVGYEAFANWEVNLVKGKAKGLSSQPGFSQADIPDIEQELLLAVHSKRNNSDKWSRFTASKRTILSRILDNRIRDLIDTAQTDKRKVQTLTDSLNKVVTIQEEGQTKTLEDYLGDDRVITLRRQPGPAPHDLEIELALRTHELSSRQQRISELFKQGFTISETAKLLGMRRTTLNREIDRMRAIFYREGLQVYLK